jgi:hypothetical protein
MMTHIRSPAELDEINGLALNAETLTRVHQVAIKYGVTPAKMATYKKACEEGWAPMPTNQYQKAVWEEIQNKKKKVVK